MQATALRYRFATRLMCTVGPLFSTAAALFSSMPISIEQIARDERRVSFQPRDSYVYSYREFLRYFEGVREITAHHLVLGAHMTYGWMPTILKLRNASESADTAAAILNAARRDDILSVAQLSLLKSLINNSMVGSSKLLHFINPHSYAIWDSKVCACLNNEGPPYHRVDSPVDYLAYLDLCKRITHDTSFSTIHNSMNSKIGYVVSTYRALELVMFMCSSE